MNCSRNEQYRQLEHSYGLRIIHITYSYPNELKVGLFIFDAGG